jgi:hypothetical protein
VAGLPLHLSTPTWRAHDTKAASAPCDDMTTHIVPQCDRAEAHLYREVGPDRDMGMEPRIRTGPSQQVGEV